MLSEYWYLIISGSRTFYQPDIRIDRRQRSRILPVEVGRCWTFLIQKFSFRRCLSKNSILHQYRYLSTPVNLQISDKVLRINTILTRTTDITVGVALLSVSLQYQTHIAWRIHIFYFACLVFLVVLFLCFFLTYVRWHGIGLKGIVNLKGYLIIVY